MAYLTIVNINLNTIFKTALILFAHVDVKLRQLLTPTSLSQQRKQKDDSTRQNLEHQSRTTPFQPKIFSLQRYPLMIIRMLLF